ncbi:MULTISPECIES: hypothetical protein [Yersinia pseudotuberculosis complex]|uniref:Immunity protein 26 n=4 Tax=Yersinia pseudotuberculosis TaxID=633 RepID=A0A0U1QVE6_YERP3|nr:MULTISPECIES: hypothetical protein [Yersinia pseudotuberculosis complex]ABS46467.1 conserved hypothetical protein [Yersinia pseudotuberculosis IP 31758]MCE4114042.1 hypothetical protein [Yersinia pseudotuberculosis]MCF1164287.1 hypothetical protein [Yersinia pseudotuberculosis]QES99399.1 hypothetical protein FOB73_14505 [Yersinia pseudotuberculosis]UFA63389.1 Uncharacterized protein YP598_3775 [Yersinia pseudotuberculosis]
MAKRIIWKVGDLVNIKLRDDLYTIGQMLTSPAMRFYKISNGNGVWEDIDLNKVEVLFRVFVGNVVNKHLVKDKIDKKSVVASDKPYEPYWIKTYTLTMDGEHYKGDRFSFPFLGGKIIDLGPDGNVSVTQAPIIKEDLALPQDRELIEKYELTNMWGHEDLSDRLCRYFDTGINRDDLKFEVFPGLWDDREKLRPLTRRLPVPLR